MCEPCVVARQRGCTYTDANGGEDVLHTLPDLRHALVQRRVAIARLPFQLVAINVVGTVLVWIIRCNTAVFGDGVRRDSLERLR